MKYLPLILLILTSCNYYNPNFLLNISGLTKGRLIITDSSTIREYKLMSSSDHMVFLEKGVLYSITHYPDFYGIPSSYPSGAIITNPKSYITLSPHLGLLSTVINDLHKYHYIVDEVLVSDLSEKFLQEVDVWRFRRSDCIDYLLGNIELYRVKGLESEIIPELMYLFHFNSENRLLREWYPGVFSFYNVTESERLTVEIYDNGEFCTLISR